MKLFIIVIAIMAIVILADIADSLTHIAKWLIEHQNKK